MIVFLFAHIRALLIALIAAGLFALVVRVTTPVVYIGSIVLWIGVVVAVTRTVLPLRAAWWDMALLSLVYVGTLLIMSLTEWPLLLTILGTFGTIALATLLGIFFANTDDTPVYMKKAFRRIHVMGWVFVCASLLITWYALSFFFQEIPVWVLLLFVGAVIALCSAAIWRMYYQVPLARFSLWLLIIAVMSMELFWVIQLLPFGYLVLGFFATWWWYILLLLIRFHMSAEGIRWKAQRRFLFGNALLFFFLLFVIRWI